MHTYIILLNIARYAKQNAALEYVLEHFNFIEFNYKSDYLLSFTYKCILIILKICVTFIKYITLLF